MVLAYVESTMSALSIPSGELQPLLARPSTSECDVLAWAQSKVAAHPAKDAAAPHLDRIARLRRTLGAASRSWQQPRSPLDLLLLRVGGTALAARLAALPEAALEGLPEYALAAAELARRSGDAGSDQDVRGALRGAATQLLAATPLEVLKHPGFWRHLRPAVEAVAGMQNELRLAAGADTVAVVDALTRGHELVAALIGPEALEAAVQLAATAPLGIGDGQGLPEAGWLEGAAPGDVAQLRLAQWVAAQLGLSVFTGCGDAPPSWDLVRRAALVVPPLPELPASLVAAFQAAAPSLLAALATQPLAALAGGRVDFWQLLAEGDEAGQALAAELRAWRAERAVAGCVAVLSSLTRAEVEALTPQQVAAVQGRVAELGVAARRLWDGGLAAAAAGRSPVHPSTLAALSAGSRRDDAAAAPQAAPTADSGAHWEALQPLAWALHTRGGSGASAARLVAAVLEGSRAAFEAEAAGVVEAADVIDDLRVAFQLEAEVARLDSVVRPDRLLSGEVDRHLEALLPETPALRPLQRQLLFGSAEAGGGGGGRGGVYHDPQQAQSLLPALLSFLGQSAVDAEARAGGPPGDAARGLLRSWREASARLAEAPKLVPAALQGLFGGLLALGSDADDTRLGALTAQEAETRVGELQRQLAAFLEAWDAEVASQADSNGIGGGAEVTTAPDGVRRPGWQASQLSGSVLGDHASVKTLMELVGEEEALGMMAAHGGRRRDAAPGDDSRDDGDAQPYEMLELVQRDIHLQRYLANEFDPSLGVDLVNAPLGWRDPRLSEEPASWLEGMRPLLDDYLAAQGERPTHDIEWKVYSGMALSEAEDAQAQHEAGLRARGHSAMHSSAADAAYLRQRLDAAVPAGSVLGPAARRYLDAVLQNSSWTFAQRRRLVDRLGEIAAALAANPPKSFRGSPFSAVLQPNGPPAVLRLSRPPVGRGARRGVALAMGVVEGKSTARAASQ